MTQVQPNWLGPFFGDDFSLEKYEKLTTSSIDRAELRDEAGLYSTKWFDYRRLHPLQTTYYFMECYKKTYQEFNRLAVDADKAPFMNPIKGNDFISHKERMSFWRLRQQVDKMGIRYEFFLTQAAVWYTNECFRQSSLYAPRPAHILRNEEFLVSVMMDWEEELATRLQIAADPWLQTQNYSGHDYQIAYEAFAINQVKSRQHKRFSLCDCLYWSNSIRLLEAVRQFGSDLVNEAIGEVNSLAK